MVSGRACERSGIVVENGAEQTANLVRGSEAVSRHEKNWLQREREAAERGTEQ